uniref:Uncharacterized protein n=1 Tax=Strigamia maritima TaxID=126957 RepID=T1J3R2_STRMM
MKPTTLYSFVIAALLAANGCRASPLIFGSSAGADAATGSNKLRVSVGFDSNPITNFFNLFQVASDRFQYLLTKLTIDGTRTVNSSVALFVNSMNATFNLVKGATIRTVDDFVVKAGELQTPLESAVSAGWDLVGDLFNQGQFLLALPVTAFTIYLKTILGALMALRFQLDAGMSFGGSFNSTTTP